MSELRDRQAQRIGRIWLIGLSLYAFGAICLLFANALIPFWGFIVVLGCTIATMIVNDTDGLVLLVASGLQFGLTQFALRSPERYLRLLPEGFRAPAGLLVLAFPILVGAFAVLRALRRRKPVRRAQIRP